MTADLVAWLSQVWDEQEKAARAAVSPARRRLAADSGDWETFHDGGVQDAASGDVIVYDEGAPNSEQADFIAANDPASVLARIAADRQILARLSALEEERRQRARDYQDWADGIDRHRKPAFSESEVKEIPGLKAALRIRAAAYADLPGWQEAWRVTT